jgi:hypothetical protein
MAGCGAVITPAKNNRLAAHAPRTIPGLNRRGLFIVSKPLSPRATRASHYQIQESMPAVECHVQWSKKTLTTQPPGLSRLVPELLPLPDYVYLP